MKPEVNIVIDRLCRMALLLCLLVGSPNAPAQVRSADEILKELNATVMPVYNVNKDTPNTHYREEFLRQRHDASKRRAELIGELYRSHPDDASVAEFLPERWETMFVVVEDYDAVLHETEELLAAHPDHSIARYAWQWRAMSAMKRFSGADAYDSGRFLAAVEDFIKRYHDDSQGPTMLYEAAAFHVPDQDKSVAILRRIVEEFPKSGAAREARWKLRQADSIGKPFELAFKDAITGREISIESLAGKIIVVDFWATWCPPCVVQMPRLKELYAKWQPQGVEFIGVSLDASEAEHGLEQLKKFVTDHEITWPQYHQGQGWQSDFSSGWGIDSIPCAFVVDHEGHLAAANVGSRLEEIVNALIATRDGTANSVGADGG